MERKVEVKPGEGPFEGKTVAWITETHPNGAVNTMPLEVSRTMVSARLLELEGTRDQLITTLSGVEAEIAMFAEILASLRTG